RSKIPDLRFAWRVPSERIPGSQLQRSDIRVEVVLEGGHGVLGDALRRPALAAVYRAKHANLREKVYLVGAHAEDLPGYVRCRIADQVDGERSDLRGLHFFHLRDARLIFRR